MATPFRSIDFIRQRAQATRSAQDQLAPTWVWEGKTVVQWDAEVAAFEASMQQAAAAEAERLAVRGSLDASLDTLHRRTMQGIALAKVKYQKDPVSFTQLENLTARGDSRMAIRDEALEWEAAWGQLDDSWEPLPGNTFPAFQALRAQCATLTDDYADKNALWRAKAETMNQLAAQLDEANVGWYAAATTVFPEGTAEGDMIRGTIPTTYNPPPPPAPPAPPTP